MTIDEMKVKLGKALSPKRYAHSVNVMETAVRLAEKHEADIERCRLAGILHDCARDIRGDSLFELCKQYGIITDEITCRQPELLHGPLGVHIAREEYGVDDKQVLEAIKCHTTGMPGMDKTARIIFLADYIEPLRSFTGVEALRRAAFQDLDRAVVMSINNTVGYILSRNGLLHPDTVNTRNWFIMNSKHVTQL